MAVHSKQVSFQRDTDHIYSEALREIDLIIAVITLEACLNIDSENLSRFLNGQTH